MPLFRGKNGEIQQTDDDDLKTRQLNRDDDEPLTGIVTKLDDELVESEEPKTRLLFRSSSSKNAEPIITKDAMTDPVVGWLVIVDGPGKGHALQLGYGMNSIGRSQHERLCLNFGDEGLSRNQHAIITYDPRGRKYYVQHGGGKNITYLDDKPLLVPTELQGGEHILVGKTTLRFVPLCGEHFDWQDNP